MKLELGAGYHRTPGFFTVDINNNTPADLICDVRHLPDDWTGMFEEIRAVDIWEHLPYRDTLPALIEWARVLQPGGRIYLQVPAADVAIERYFVNGAATAEEWRRRMPDDIRQISPMSCLQWVLLGGQDDGEMAREGDDPRWNLHMALFDEQTVRYCGHRAGLLIESLEVNPHPNYCVWMIKP